MQITIRKALESDSVSLLHLCEQLGYASGEKDMIQRIKQLDVSSNDCLLIAEIDKKIIGWIHVFYTVRLESGAFTEIGGFVVDELYRGKGVGTLLLKEAVKWSGDKTKKLRVRCRTDRTEAHLFYQHKGFIELKEQKIFELVI